MSVSRNVRRRIRGEGRGRRPEAKRSRVGALGGTLKAALASALVVGSTLAAVSFIGVGTAGANAANPNDNTTGAVTVNGDGTVTVDLTGTWSWPGQDCAGRYGTGWSVDWWGLSTSSTPNPNFDLTDASIVDPPGTTTTGTVSPTGTAVMTKHPLAGGKFFHVGEFYSGETVNSPSTCTDTGSGQTAGSEGNWSASATYPNLADVPPQLCVNMYDEHGTEGNISNNAKDFDPVTNDDNSINTNAFDPTDGQGFCLATTTTVTHASTSTIVLGAGTVNDSATVTGQSGEGLPTGTVNFYVCGPLETTGLCTSTSNPVGTPSVPSNADSGFTSTATSSQFTPTAVGTWCFAAVFVPISGSNYAGSEDNQSGTTDANECFTVTPAPSQTTTQTSTTTTGEGSVVIGPNGSVTDHVTVTGNDVGGVPSGTVSFFICGPSTSNQTCNPSTGMPEGTPSLSGTGDTSTATSNSFLPSKVGTYCFSAVYNPDSSSQYLSSTDNTDGDPVASECFTVNPALTVTTTQTSAATTGEGSVVIGASGQVTDSVTVTGNETAGAPDGTVAFFVCGPSSSTQLCTSSGTAEGTPTLTSATTSTSTATSNVFSPSQPGTYCFGAVYTPGDGSNYVGSTDNVTGTVQTNECFTVSAPSTTPQVVTPTTTTTAAPVTKPATAAAIAFTGADISVMAASGAGLIALGGTLVLISRRRRRAAADGAR